MPRLIVGQLLLAALNHEEQTFTKKVQAALSGPLWIAVEKSVRQRLIELFQSGDRDAWSKQLAGWSDEEIVEELSRHFARLPGWASWAKWNDVWARERHPFSITRRQFASLSLAVDLALIAQSGTPPLTPPQPLHATLDSKGVARLFSLEEGVHAEMIKRLSLNSAKKGSSPNLQVVCCIDVRSEPLRRALEQNDDVETFGFAGFFGIPAQVKLPSARQGYDSLPVLVSPSVRIVGTKPMVPSKETRTSAGETFAQLTHEPTAMFALAESAGFFAAPWLIGRFLGSQKRESDNEDQNKWRVEGEGVVEIAEGALRGMGLTKRFAPEVLFLGHSATTSNNPHSAALQCGACGGHGGGPNAAALAALLNDEQIREALRLRNITIPSTTTFYSGVHNTTLETVTFHTTPGASSRYKVRIASEEVARWRSAMKNSPLSSVRRRLRARANDWAQVRPEWGLADHCAFILGPRTSTRGVDLSGRAFLHSYDATSDPDGAILMALFSAPVVVAQWINTSYYFSTVAPQLLGAGDKTLHNPVFDIAVLSGDDPDLRMGLPLQSVALGTRPYHLPVRLLLCVEAPLKRIAQALESATLPRQLIEGEWIKLIARESPTDPWQKYLSDGNFDAPHTVAFSEASL